jgi:predicted enzyme related to lactoylglutathione lyase
MDQTLAAASHAGGKLVSGSRLTSRGRMAVVKDPDGHRIELLEPAADA